MLMLLQILSVLACCLLAVVKLRGVGFVFTVCVVASSVLVKSFSCCQNTSDSEKTNSRCWEEHSQCRWPGAAGMGGCSPALCEDRVDPQRRAAFLT